VFSGQVRWKDLAEREPQGDGIALRSFDFVGHVRLFLLGEERIWYGFQELHSCKIHVSEPYCAKDVLAMSVAGQEAVALGIGDINRVSQRRHSH